MHLASLLKRRAPPQRQPRAQDRAFDRFRREYNRIRPHEALDGQVPTYLYENSPRPLPTKLEPVEDPGRFEKRFVSRNVGVRWYTRRVTGNSLLAGRYVALEEIDHGLFNVYFGPVWLGRFIERKNVIIDAKGPAGQRHGGGSIKGGHSVTQAS